MYVFIVVFVAVLCLASGAAAAGVAVWKQEERKLHALEAARLDQLRESREAMKAKKKEVERLREAVKARDATLYSLQKRVNDLETAARGGNG